MQLNDLAGINKNRKGYLQSDKGYYVTGFNTLIKKATTKDIDLALTYALELISSFEEINQKLLSYNLIDKKQKLDSLLLVYDIKVGKIYVGRIYIELMDLIQRKMISFSYYKRVSFNEFNQYIDIHNSYKNFSAKEANRRKQRNYYKRKKYRK